MWVLGYYYECFVFAGPFLAVIKPISAFQIYFPV